MKYSAEIKKLARNYLPEDFVVSDWAGLEPFFKELLEREPESKESLEQWLKDQGELEAVLKNDQIAPDGFLRNTLVFAMLPEKFNKNKTQFDIWPSCHITFINRFQANLQQPKRIQQQCTEHPLAYRRHQLPKSPRN